MRKRVYGLSTGIAVVAAVLLGGNIFFEEAQSMPPSVPGTPGMSLTEGLQPSILEASEPLSIELQAGGAPQTPAEPAAEKNVKKLTEEACSTCHGMELVSDARYSKTDWTSVVQRMVDHGASLTKEQIPLVVDYLYKVYPDKK